MLRAIVGNGQNTCFVVSLPKIYVLFGMSSQVLVFCGTFPYRPHARAKKGVCKSYNLHNK